MAHRIKIVFCMFSLSLLQFLSLNLSLHLVLLSKPTPPFLPPSSWSLPQIVLSSRALKAFFPQRSMAERDPLKRRREERALRLQCPLRIIHGAVWPLPSPFNLSIATPRQRAMLGCQQQLKPKQ